MESMKIMRLWTWQKRDFDITNKDVRVENLENSQYANGPGENRSEHFKTIYSRLFKKLGTDQFHWFFKEEDEAKSKESHIEFYKQGRVLWEINVPVANVFKRICGIAWNHLLKTNTFPSKLHDYWRLKANYDHSLIEKWKQEFEDFWGSKSEDELWDLLLLKKAVEGCTQVLLRHPLENTWIVRNPIDESNWWETKKRQDGSRLYTCPLPCEECLGRR